MSQTPFTDSVAADGDNCQLFFRGEAGPTIKILLYTDAPDVFTLEDVKFHGLALMLQQLDGHAPTFANLCIKWVSRYPANNPQEIKKLNVVLEEELSATGKPFDEIWFFGLAQASKRRFSLQFAPGGPDSDLDNQEVSALTDWMSARENPGGGVLMTGDHSEERRTEPPATDTDSVCPDTATTERFLGLGRALGRCVPRARQLRIWEGGPTKRAVDSYNTVQSVGLQAGLQGDPQAQELLLKRFDEHGAPSLDGQPHPLFFYKPGSWIEVFPDHQHEGAVVVPVIAPGDEEWPGGTLLRPLPREVACGINKRNYQIINIVAAYDGDLAGVGRIVADSTWHHYISMNLISFTHPAPVGSASDKIGQYYGNLAVWLSPLDKRRQMAQAMFDWLIYNPLMREELGNDRLDIGQAAYSLLATVASPCEIHELLLAVVPDRIRARFESLYFPDRGYALSELPSKELILGCVLDLYHQELIRVETSDEPCEARPLVQIADAGLEAAFGGQREQIARMDSAARRLANPTNPTLNEEEEGETAMVACEASQWTIELITQPASTRLRGGVLVFEIRTVTGSNISGDVFEQANPTPISAFTGTCRAVERQHLHLLTFEFEWGEASVVLAGVAFRSDLNRFIGRFHATPRTARAAEREVAAALVSGPPDPGDTGTGTGTQT